jgi:hypothetical protein
MPGNQLNIPLETALRRLQLCSYAIQEIHVELEQPDDPEAKADLLLATENLVYEALDLLQTVKGYAWGRELESELIPPDDLLN